MATSEKLVVLSFTCGHDILIPAGNFSVLYKKGRMEGKIHGTDEKGKRRAAGVYPAGS